MTPTASGVSDTSFSLSDLMDRLQEHEYGSAEQTRRKSSSKDKDMNKDVFDHWTQMTFDESIVKTKWKCNYCSKIILHKKDRFVKHLIDKHGYNRSVETFDNRTFILNDDDVITPATPGVVDTFPGERVRIHKKRADGRA